MSGVRFGRKRAILTKLPMKCSNCCNVVGVKRRQDAENSHQNFGDHRVCGMFVNETCLFEGNNVSLVECSD